jgi:hypothetical protein
VRRETTDHGPRTTDHGLPEESTRLSSRDRSVITEL